MLNLKNITIVGIGGHDCNRSVLHEAEVGRLGAEDQSMRGNPDSKCS